MNPLKPFNQTELDLIEQYQGKAIPFDVAVNLLQAEGVVLDLGKLDWLKGNYQPKTSEETTEEPAKQPDGNDVDPTFDLKARRKMLSMREFEVKEQKIEVDALKIGEAFRALKDNEAEKAAVSALNLDSLPSEYTDQSRIEHRDYLESAVYRLRCIHEVFDPVVPLFRGNLLLGGAKTGQGKSSFAAELAAEVVKSINPRTGKPSRVVIIVNEETRGEMFTRIYFLLAGKKYTNLDRLTPKERDEVDKFQIDMTESKRLVVIDDGFQGVRQLTSSVEGLETILSSLSKNKNDFDLLILDYFQKVAQSKLRPGDDTTKILTRVVNMLDHYRKILTYPIFVMAQLKPKDAQHGDFQSRLKDRKTILDVATFAFEIEADTENYVTNFHVVKNRLVQGTVGKTFQLGFDREIGKLVTVDSDFAKRATDWAIGDKLRKKETKGDSNGNE